MTTLVHGSAERGGGIVLGRPHCAGGRHVHRHPSIEVWPGQPPSVTVTVHDVLDIGTTSVKAVAADGDGTVLGPVRVSPDIRMPFAGAFEHGVDAA